MRQYVQYFRLRGGIWVKVAYISDLHCHEQEVYQQQEALYYMNALGYPDEKLPRKIRVFTV